MESRLSFVLVAFIILCNCTGGNEQKQESLTALKKEISMKLIHDSIDYAFALAEKVEVLYPNDPQMPMVKAVIFQSRNMNDSAKYSFKRSYMLYDSLLHIRPCITFSINKAVCLMFLEGRDAYNDELDKILENDSYRKDISAIEEYVEMLRLLQREDVERAFFQTRSWYYLK